MVIIGSLCVLLATASHTEQANCPAFCKIVQNGFCFCESGYNEYGGKKEIAKYDETKSPIARRRNLYATTGEDVTDLVTASKVKGERRLMGKIFLQICDKMRSKAFGKVTRLYRRLIKLQYIKLLNFN